MNNTQFFRMLKRNFGAILLLLLLGGCSIAGPFSVEASRTDYNVTLQRTDDEQLLLNIVRFRYLDRPLFLQNSSLTTSFNFTRSLSGSATLLPHVSDPYNLSGNLSFSEAPTISYTPLQGNDFAQRLLGRIPLESLILLDTSGWKADRVLRVCLQRVNNIGNAVTAGGPSPTIAPDYEQFKEMAALITELEHEDLVVVDHEVSGQPTSNLVLHFRPPARERPEYKLITEMLKLDPSLGQYKLTTEREHFGGDTISVETRSFASVLYFLSQSVQVPDRDLDNGNVGITRNRDGGVFNWFEVMGDLMRIQSSEWSPSHAAVAVQYRGHWFYIDDADIEAKTTFVMLGQLYALVSETAPGFAPMLTLPVAQ